MKTANKSNMKELITALENNECSPLDAALAIIGEYSDACDYAEDNDGQIVIYTGLCFRRNKLVKYDL